MRQGTEEREEVLPVQTIESSIEKQIVCCLLKDF